MLRDLDFIPFRSLMRAREAAGGGLQGIIDAEGRHNRRMLFLGYRFLETKRMEQIGILMLSIW